VVFNSCEGPDHSHCVGITTFNPARSVK